MSAGTLSVEAPVPPAEGPTLNEISQRLQAASLSSQVWAMVQGGFDKGVGKPLNNVLDMTGVSGLYKSVFGSEIPQLHSSIEAQKTPLDRLAYAAGESIGENLPLLLLSAGVPGMVRFFNVRQMVYGSKMLASGEHMISSAAHFSQEGGLSGILGSTMSMGGTGLKTLGEASRNFRWAQHDILRTGLAGFGQGMLTADVGEHGWSNRFAAGAYSSGMALVERKAGEKLIEKLPTKIRIHYDQNGPYRLSGPQELRVFALAGGAVGAASAEIESAIKHGKQGSWEEVGGNGLGHGIAGTILAVREENFRSGFYRSAHYAQMAKLSRVRF
jgi:hypothetical protein